jgi:hypothetical protein
MSKNKAKTTKPKAKDDDEDWEAMLAAEAISNGQDRVNRLIIERRREFPSPCHNPSQLSTFFYHLRYHHFFFWKHSIGAAAAQLKKEASEKESEKTPPIAGEDDADSEDDEEDGADAGARKVCQILF